ncbi:transcription factor bHLH61-like [Aristolochia californica]|uniref:transcription factor bHLH61-like n=1 Tax=Aristolochia californica TaxID=171875 RepID=UPI0035DCAE21
MSLLFSSFPMFSIKHGRTDCNCSQRNAFYRDHLIIIPLQAFNTRRFSTQHSIIQKKNYMLRRRNKFKIKNNRDFGSSALSKASIIVDASKYIEELKQKVGRMNQDIALAQTSSDQNLPVVTVETQERNFSINVFSNKSCPGLLVSVLEKFEELGLNLIEARVSCEDTFHLEAMGGESQDQGENIDAHVIKQAVMQAIKTWSGNANED